MPSREVRYRSDELIESLSRSSAVLTVEQLRAHTQGQPGGNTYNFVSIANTNILESQQYNINGSRGNQGSATVARKSTYISLLAWRSYAP